MNAIKKRIDAIIRVAEIHADENAILETWYRQTAETARQIGDSIDTQVMEFENLSLALSALQSNVQIVTTDVLNEGVEALLTAVGNYRIDDAETAYGGVIASAKDGLISVGSVIIETLQSITILESALGMLSVELKPKAEFIMSGDVPITTEKQPYEGSKFEEPAPQEDDSPMSQPVEEEPEEPEPEKPAEPEVTEVEEPEEEQKTLFGIPISEIKETCPGVNVDALIEPVPQKIVSSKPDVDESKYPKNPGVRPQQISRGFTEVHIPGYPADQFMISEKNLLVDRYTGRTIRTFRRHDTEFVSVRKYGSSISTDIKFEDIIRWARGEEPADPPVAKEPRFVYVNWIEGLPKTKYKVYETGRIYDTVNDTYLVGSGEKVTLSAGDIASKDVGVTSPQFTFTRQSLVYRAFHPEVRDRAKLRIKFKDGDRKNCTIDNLMYQ